jgi:hypothetical protein
VKLSPRDDYWSGSLPYCPRYAARSRALRPLAGRSASAGWRSSLERAFQSSIPRPLGALPNYVTPG